MLLLRCVPDTASAPRQIPCSGFCWHHRELISSPALESAPGWFRNCSRYCQRSVPDSCSVIQLLSGSVLAAKPECGAGSRQSDAAWQRGSRRENSRGCPNPNFCAAKIVEFPDCRRRQVAGVDGNRPRVRDLPPTEPATEPVNNCWHHRELISSAALESVYVAASMCSRYCQRSVPDSCSAVQPAKVAQDLRARSIWPLPIRTSTIVSIISFPNTFSDNLFIGSSR